MRRLQKFGVWAVVLTLVAAISIGEIPLAVCGARVIAWRGYRIHAKLGHQSSPNVVIVKVAAELLHLDFVRAKEFARPTHRVVRRMIEVVCAIDVSSNFWCKEIAVPINIFGAGITVEPSPIPV